MMLAVAAALSSCRLLSRQSIYMMKLARREHDIPKALHVSGAPGQGGSSFADFTVGPAETPLVTERDALFDIGDAEPQPGTDTYDPEDPIALRHNDVAHRTVMLGPPHELYVAQWNFALVRENDVPFDVIYRLWRRNAVMALVVPSAEHPRRPRPGDILGFITKEHVADAVAGSLQFYPRRSDCPPLRVSPIVLAAA